MKNEKLRMKNPEEGTGKYGEFSFLFQFFMINLNSSLIIALCR